MQKRQYQLLRLKIRLMCLEKEADLDQGISNLALAELFHVLYYAEFSSNHVLPMGIMKRNLFLSLSN